jgi:hypothetical protein
LTRFAIQGKSPLPSAPYFRKAKIVKEKVKEKREKRGIFKTQASTWVFSCLLKSRIIHSLKLFHP